MIAAMGLSIVPNPHAADVVALLRKICPDPALIITIGTVTLPSPSPGSPSVTVSMPGTVSYTPPAGASKTCVLLGALANSTQTITIEMVAGSFVVGGKTMDTKAGVTLDTPLHKVNKDWGRIEIYLDASNGGGGGYYAVAPGGGHIDLPMDVVLAHEMGHAFQFLSSSFSGLNEALATDAENDYRTERGLPLRDRAVYDGGRKVPVAAPTTPTPTPSTGPKKCFIATAALGSPLHPDVVMLRSLRDNILRKTRTGTAFYDWFYDRYYRFSPAVVEMMEQDPKVRDMVHWIAVTPIVNYLDALVTMPEGSLENVPPPWREFLEKIRNGFENFAGAIEPPIDFAGQSAEDAVTELALILRYRFRTPQSRRTYLDRLHQTSALPIAVADENEEKKLHTLLNSFGIALNLDDSAKPIIVTGQRATSVCGVFGGNDALVGNARFMYVMLSNTSSSDLVDEVALAYKRSDMNLSTLVTLGPLVPGDSVMFCLGDASKVTSFSFDGFLNGTNVLALEGFDVSDPFIQQHEIAPNTYEFFYDGPPIM